MGNFSPFLQLKAFKPMLLCKNFFAIVKNLEYHQRREFFKGTNLTKFICKVSAINTCAYFWREFLMKKRFFITLLCIVCLACAYAGGGTNLQKIYPITSQEYEAIKYVYLCQGHSLPSTTGPYSGDELLKMIVEIEDEISNDVLVKMLQDAKKSILAEHQIKTSSIDIEFSGDVNLELYYHTNTDGYERTLTSSQKDKTITEKAFQGRDQWVYNSSKQKPFVTINWETWAANHFYALFQLNIQNTVHSGRVNYYSGDYSKELGVKALSTNILFLQNLEFNPALIDGNYPNRAFVSAGGDGWSVQFGKDRLSWGAGTTGNLTISDNLPHHNMVRFTTYSNKYKYTFLTSFFPHPQNYWGETTTTEGGSTAKPIWQGLNQITGSEKYGPLKGIRFYTAHRVEGRFFSDKLTLTLTEGLMYMSEDNTIDIRALNPVNFNHNNYTKPTSNSTLAFEADWTIIKGLNVYGQVIVDELAFPMIETGPTESNSDAPSAFGFLLGVQGAFAVKSGVLHASLEFAKTDPYLYLRDVEEYGSEVDSYGLNYVVAVRNWSSSTNTISYDEYALGYTYGPDALVGNLNANWTSSDFKLKLGGNVFFMAHGTHDLWTQWATFGGSKTEDTHYSYEEYVKNNKSTPTQGHTTANDKYPNAQNVRNSVQYTTVVGASASYVIIKGLSVFAQVDFININNYGNEKGNKQQDLQMVLSLSYSF